LRLSRSWNPEQKQVRQKEDLLLLAGYHSKNQNSDNNKNNIPTEYTFYQNYPNPFNPVTKINYDLPVDSKVSIVIYDILGREIKKLVNNEFKPAGKYTVEFNGQMYASGVYFYRIIAEGNKKFINAKRMVLIK